MLLLFISPFASGSRRATYTYFAFSFSLYEMNELPFSFLFLDYLGRQYYHQGEKSNNEMSMTSLETNFSCPFDILTQ